MGFFGRIKENNRRISDALAGRRQYFTFCTTNLALYRIVTRLAPRGVVGRVLDAGAGRQAYRPLLSIYAEGIDTLDISDQEGRTDYVGDIQNMPLADDTYDSVLCAQVLHHVPDPQRAVREIARVLKPGGKALITVPHLSWLHNEPHDYFRFTVHGLRHMLARANLEEIEIVPAGGLICFLGYIPTATCMGLCWSLRWLFRLMLPVNALFVRVCLALDRLIGALRLYPANYVVLARKTEGSAAETQRVAAAR